MSRLAKSPLLRKLIPCLVTMVFLASLISVLTDEVWAAEIDPAQSQFTVILPATDNSSGPIPIKVGVYVLNVGKFETATGSFTIDFYLSFTSDNASSPGSFEFSNGRATSLDKSADEPTLKFYRIQASLADNLNLSNYPFDRHNLTIEIEDKEQTVNTQVYVVSREDSGLDPAVQVAGWEMDGWDARVENHYYQPYDTTFSKYVFSIGIHRSATAAILKIILPALTILLVGMLSLVMGPDKILPRLTISTGALTGLILFHLNMTSSLPPLAYLTFGDRFMLFNYFTLALCAVSSLIALYFVEKKLNDKANRVHNIALFVIPLIWLGLQISNLLML